jgi:hypothetical protein
MFKALAGGENPARGEDIDNNTGFQYILITAALSAASFSSSRRGVFQTSGQAA